MAKITWIALIFIMDFNYAYGKARGVCPVVKCPAVIPKNCRKAEYIIGTDLKTKCRVCDSNICGPYEEVCPAIDCPWDHKIKKDCRRPNFMIGTDGITKCVLCDSNVCGKMIRVCPMPRCRNLSSIPKRCRAKAYTIGADGITRCRACDKNICLKE